LPLRTVRLVVAATLIALGLYRILRKRHFQWSKMQVRFHELALWSFLMASAHGAGLMVLPVVMELSPVQGAGMEHMHSHSLPVPATGVLATVVHTLGYFVVTAAMALLVYRKFGLSMLRKAWFNLDLLWAIALIITGCVALIL
jgi:multisubunit Na+/H+ antiporter MnhC subunit